MTERFNVAILGTGLFGAALAYHLARDRSQRVVALDAPPNPDRPNATATSAGILSVQGWDPWDLAIVRESAREYRDLVESEGAALLRRDGGLRVARTEEGARWLERVRRVLARAGSEARWVGPGEVRELLPFADLGDAISALFTPDDATISPPETQAAYLRAAARSGAVVSPLPGPARILPSNEGGWSIETPRSVTARTLVIASGAWSKAVLGSLGHALPLAPFRAQALQLRPRPLLAPFPTLHDLDLSLYVRSGPFGRLVAGDGNSTREQDPFDWNPSADPVFVDATVDALSGVFRELGSIRVESARAGLCVASPDRFPLVGRVPGTADLVIACGFNGLGTMRAAGLARRLADALRTGDWAPLGPADPARFSLPAPPFDPRPEFPLEATGSETEAIDEPRPGQDRPASSFERSWDDLGLRVLSGPDDVDRLRWTSLSDWFDPFLPLFARDALRTGGSVEVAEEEGAVRGLRLFGSSEGVGSGFTRERRIAERFLERMDEVGLYLEEPWRPGGQPIEVFAADLRDWAARERLRNPVRLGQREDLGGIRLLMRAELGPGVDPWLATLPRPEETAFLCEIDGRIVGVSWLSRVGPFARGHSFVVHPRFRGLGIGTDLLTARMLWLERTGARWVVSEIYDGNAASRKAAERAGMARVGEMFHFRPPSGGRGAATSGPPRTAGTSSGSSR